ncbi:transporter, major facilitator family protein, partial [Teladorsagia circumcincta]
MDKKTSPLYNGSISEEIDWASSDLPIGDRRFSYGVLEKSLSFAGGFIGSMAAIFPVNFLLRKYGPHKVMTVIGTICTLMVALTPVVICWSFPAFIILRVISGIAVSNSFPVAGHLVNEWAAITEKGLFVAVLSGHIELSALVTMPLSGLIASKVSWDMVFYFHATLCGLFTFFWAIYYRDKATKHPFVAKRESQRISQGKQPSNTKAGLVIKMLTGLASDRLKCLPEVGKLRLFNSIALLGSGLFFIVLSVVPPGRGAIDVILIVIPIALLGFSSGGYPKCAVMVSQQHSPLVMSIVQ